MRLLDSLRAATPSSAQGRDQRDITLTAWLTGYVDGRREELQPGTLGKLEWHVALTQGHEVGDTPLGRLTPARLEAFYRHLMAGHKRSTVGDVAGLVKRALRRAVRHEIIPNNPADATELPRGRRADRERVAQILQAGDVQRLVKAAREDTLWPLWHLALSCGLRHGELLGLQWRDLSWAHQELSINRTVIVVNNRPTVGSPKTSSSERAIPLPGEVIATLRAWQTNPERPHSADGWLFCTASGTPLLQNNVRRSWKRLLGRAGLPNSIRIHDLRHTYASMLIAHGIDPRTVSDLLGHSDTRFTLSHYVHSERRARLRAARIEPSDLYRD
ncbi:tyrosine-type recombinase/integrase [Deinococcus maricopensis]|uniref:tyrosine-type recombinase/integrase n=1 Tax=Deinococcus maricopensis TaxID=309887 RepID=UPI0005C1DB99|nr:site-specific integrase [Deinococcus maricopensis]